MQDSSTLEDSRVLDVTPTEQMVDIPLGSCGATTGLLFIPQYASSIVMLAHGPGNIKQCSCNRFVARMLHQMGFATLLLDITERGECRSDRMVGSFSDMRFLTKRLIAATSWVAVQRATQHLQIEYVGAGAAAEAAMMAAVKQPGLVGGVVGRSWRPDLSNIMLSQVLNPTLLIVGGRDTDSARLNREALALIGAQEKDLEIVPGATQLFEEPGALEASAVRTGMWFERFKARPLKGLHVQRQIPLMNSH